MKQLFAIGMLMAALSLTVNAQNTFSSGSTGADGAFSPTASQTITVPASGVFNYTTVNIPTGVVITYVANSANTSLTILASGTVQINGTIHVDGQNGAASGFGGLGGPGGARGGNGGANGASGTPGDGPGGGKGGTFNASGSPICVSGGGGGFQLAGGGSGLGGATYGTPSLVPLIGGSGGGGGCANAGNNTGGGGGGGGGAILIASSSSIAFSSSPSSNITAQGGFCSSCSTSPNLTPGGGGSGGAIRLVANSISGFVSLNVTGGSGLNTGGAGYIRVETFNTTAFNPTNQGAPISSALPGSAVPANVPSLQIVSIAGVAVPSTPIGSFQGSPDVVLPANQTNPVSVVINAANIPVGSTVNLTALPANGAGASATTTLAGSLTSSSGTVSISLPGGLSVLTATTIINLATLGDLRPLFINGERVEKIEVAARFGGGSQIAYITHSGRRIQVR